MPNLPFALSRMPALRRPLLRASLLPLAVAAYLVFALNGRFWSIARESAGPGLSSLGVLAAVGAALFALTLLMLLPLSGRWTLRPGLAVVLLLASAAAYFIQDYGAVIDRHALSSVYATDPREAGEWLSWRMAWQLLVFGLLPAALLWWPRIEHRPWSRELWSRFKLGLLALALLGVAAGAYGKDVASLVRNRMELRHIANPFALLAAQLSYLDHLGDGDRPLQAIAIDARRGTALASSPRPVLLVLVVGESLRAASLDLNGYARDTDVDLHPVPIVNFSEVQSCGTNTATSVPCMFSGLGRRDYDAGDAKYRENLLDALMRGGYDVVWVDNNTGSKGLAARATEMHAAAAADPALCNAEGCYDQVLVEKLRTLAAGIRRDTVVVLHMLGSHGPAYYARYPEAAAAFKPECRTNALQTCSDTALRNTYDNTVLYTTHVLAETLALLGEPHAALDPLPAAIRACIARHGHGRGDGGGEVCPPLPVVPPATPRTAPAFDAALLFVSDHGESLGEKGLYLHGAPYAIAPSEQTHVPMLFWSSPGFASRRGLDLGCLHERSGESLSHDHFFHSVLGLADVRTQARAPALDLFAPCIAAPVGGTASR